MLGRLGMSVDTCIRAYKALSHRAFTQNGGLSFPIEFDWNTWSLYPRYQFDAQELEKAIKDLVKWRTNDEEAILLEDEPQCKM